VAAAPLEWKNAIVAEIDARIARGPREPARRPPSPQADLYLP
jgi:hypothetical protein